jgi:hypothetical protein
VNLVTTVAALFQRLVNDGNQGRWQYLLEAVQRSRAVLQSNPEMVSNPLKADDSQTVTDQPIQLDTCVQIGSTVLRRGVAKLGVLSLLKERLT